MEQLTFLAAHISLQLDEVSKVESAQKERAHRMHPRPRTNTPALGTTGILSGTLKSVNRFQVHVHAKNIA